MERTNTAKWEEKYGRWKINVQKDGVRKSFYSSTKGRTGQREANKKADEWLEFDVANDMTFEELYKKWLTSVKKTTSEYNYNDREKHGRVWILPAVGRKKMSRLTEQDFQDILDSAYVAGRAEKTIKNIRGTIITFMKYAKRCGKTTMVPESLTVSKNAPVGKRSIVSLNDAKKLFQTPKKEYWYLNAFRFFFLTGLREGELIRLKKTDIKNGMCHIEKGKNTNAIRDFMLTTSMRKVINDQLEKIENMDTEYLFPSFKGKKSSRNTIYKQWQAFQKDLDFVNRTSIHELRHTFVSYSKGIPTELLKSQVGHSKTMDTFGQYGHLTETDYSDLSNLLEKRFKKII